MLMEALLFKGKDSAKFENVGSGATMEKIVSEVTYREFYKQNYMWLTFSFDDGYDLIQFKPDDS